LEVFQRKIKKKLLRRQPKQVSRGPGGALIGLSFPTLLGNSNLKNQKMVQGTPRETLDMKKKLKKPRHTLATLDPKRGFPLKRKTEGPLAVKMKKSLNEDGRANPLGG